MSLKTSRIFILLGILFATAAVFGFGVLHKKQVRSEAVSNEVAAVRAYFIEYYDYYLEEIPGYVSVSPCPADVFGISEFPRYMLLKMGEEYQGFYFYPFSSREEAASVYREVGEEEWDRFYLVSQSIFYDGSGLRDSEDMFRMADDYFRELS